MKILAAMVGAVLAVGGAVAQAVEANALLFDQMTKVAARERDSTWIAGQDNQWLTRLHLTPVERADGQLPEYVQVVDMTPTFLVDPNAPEARGSVHYTCQQMRTWNPRSRQWTQWQPCARPVYSVYVQRVGQEWATQGVTVVPGGAWARPRRPDLGAVPPG